jgi:hypothetical protein
MDPGTPMALSPDYLAALIDLRVAELRELAARTAVEYWRARPTLAERYFPSLPRSNGNSPRMVRRVSLGAIITGKAADDVVSLGGAEAQIFFSRRQRHLQGGVCHHDTFWR